jgi:hypothetical protein
MQPSREQVLWATVLGQAILDALGRSGYNPKEYRRDGGTYDPRLEARLWILEGGEDFRTVAALAGLDPDAVRAAVLNTPDRIGPIYLAGPETRKRRTSQPAPESCSA